MNYAWVAGIVEGEGWFSPSKNGSVRMTIGSTDRDVLENVQKVTGLGNISKPYYRENANKPMYYWTLQRREDVKKVLLAIRPYMLSRRTAQIDECLKGIERLEARTGLPVGVRQYHNRYVAQYRRDYLGTFSTPEEAKEAYEKARANG
jgi:hypothetical protein